LLPRNRHQTNNNRNENQVTKPVARKTTATDDFYEDMAVMRKLVSDIFDALPKVKSDKAAAFAAMGFAASSQEPKWPSGIDDELEPIDFDAITRPIQAAIAEGFPCA
jgi:hypothetical protein